MTRIYVDTEFSDFTDTQLISLGAVAEGGQEFYVELDPLPTSTSEFVQSHVLPLLEGGHHQIQRYKFNEHFAAWAAQFNDPVLISDSGWDLAMVRAGFGRTPTQQAGILNYFDLRLTLITIPALSAEAQVLFNETLAQQFAADPRQHHALVDARALKAAVEAVEAQLGLSQQSADTQAPAASRKQANLYSD